MTTLRAIPDNHEHDDTPAPQGTSWARVDLVQTLADGPPPPPELLTDQDGIGLFYRGARHILSGDPEAGKSWIALAASLQVMRAGGRVIWLDFDDMTDREAAARLEAMGCTEPEFERLWFAAPDEAAVSAAGHVPEFEHMLEWQPDLVVVDSYTPALSTHALNPNAAEDIDLFDLHVVRPFIRQAAAVLIIDHLPKDRDAAAGRYSIASSRKLGLTDVHWRAVVAQPFGRGREGSARLSVQKDRRGWLRGSIGGALFTLDARGPEIVWNVTIDKREPGSTWRPTHLMQKVSEYLEQMIDDVTAGQIFREVKGKEEHLRAAIGHLVDGGYASRQRGERGSVLIQHVLAYTDPKVAKTSQSPAPGLGGIGSGFQDELTTSTQSPENTCKTQVNATQSHPIPTQSPNGVDPIPQGPPPLRGESHKVDCPHCHHGRIVATALGDHRCNRCGTPHPNEGA